jgi:hypothetical protein
MNLQNHEIGSLRNSGICWRSNSEVKAREWGDSRISKKQSQDVVSKSPGSMCELVAGL